MKSREIKGSVRRSLREAPGTARQIAKRTNLSLSRVRRELRDMKEKGEAKWVADWHGGRTGGYSRVWRLTP